MQNITIDSLKDIASSTKRFKFIITENAIDSSKSELNINNETVAFVYEPLACHSYNIIRIDNLDIKVATIDTILSFYLAFLYANRPYYDHDRLICMAEYLFMVQAKNRLEQKGLLRRFSISCYGKQPTLETIRAEKTEKFKELKDNRNSEEFEYNFLRYIPAEKAKKTTKTIDKKKKSIRNKTKTKTKSKTTTKKTNKR